MLKDEFIGVLERGNFAFPLEDGPDFRIGNTTSSQIGLKYNRKLVQIIIQELDILTIFTDGSAQGNPGPGNAKYFIDDKSFELIEGYKRLDNSTNNQAEYEGVILALTDLLKTKIKRPLEILCDSKLIVNQLTGKYKIKDKELQKLHTKVKNLEKNFSSVKYKWIPRDLNKAH